MEKQRCQAGFTLIELLIAVSILGVLMTGLTSIYRTGVVSSSSNEKLINLQNEARVIKRMVENDVRSSTGDFDEIYYEGTLVGFKIDDGIEYREANDKLVREEDGSEHTLTDNLENFDFTINDNGLVSINDITLRSGRGIEYAFSDRVYARKIGVALGGGSGGDNPGDDPEEAEITFHYKIPEWHNDNEEVRVTYYEQGDESGSRINMNKEGDNHYTKTVDVEDEEDEIEFVLSFVSENDGYRKYLKATDNHYDRMTYETNTGKIWINSENIDNDYWGGEDKNDYYLDSSNYSDNGF